MALLVFCLGAGAVDRAGQFEVAPGFLIQPVGHNTLRPSAMAWDDFGSLWVLEPRPTARGGPAGSALKRVGSFGVDGAPADVREVAADLPDSAAIVVSPDDVYLGVAGGLLRLGPDGRQTTHALPGGEFPAGAVVQGMRWGPDLRVYFCYASAAAGDQGVGRFDPTSGKAELYSEGLDGRVIDFDPDGFPLVRPVPSGEVFPVAPGGRYLTGPEAAEGVPTEALPLFRALPREAAAGGFAIYDGEQFPPENHGTLLVARPGTGAIQQLRLGRRGGALVAEAWRDLVTPVEGMSFDPVWIDTGPDGAVWILDRGGACPGTGGRLWRLVHGADGAAAPWPSPRDLGKVATGELVELLKRPDGRQRSSAVRALTSREIDNSDSFHRKTAIDEVMDAGKTGRQRLAGLWALSALNILDEDALDRAAKDDAEAVRAWAATITGERAMPLGSAITRLRTLSRDQSVWVRQAVAFAARRFVSGSIVRDTPPAVGLREVLTGPVLSGLWPGLNQANDPALYTAYWNALRPVATFDPVHVIAYWEDNAAAGEMPMYGWVLRRIMAQLCGASPKQFEAAVVQMGKIPMKEAPAIAAGLDGLVEGSEAMRSPPGEAAKVVVRTWAASDDTQVAAKAKQLLRMWDSRAAGTSQQGSLEPAERSQR